MIDRDNYFSWVGLYIVKGAIVVYYAIEKYPIFWLNGLIMGPTMYGKKL